MYSSATLESVLAQAADAALLFANEQACHVLKYRAGELHGQSVELLIPDRYRLAHIGHRLRFSDDRRTRPMGAGLELFAPMQGWFRAPSGDRLETGSARIGDSDCPDDPSARVGFSDASRKVMQSRKYPRCNCASYRENSSSSARSS
jgi:hypothetical protein